MALTASEQIAKDAGFAVPEGADLVREGDDAIRANAVAAMRSLRPRTDLPSAVGNLLGFDRTGVYQYPTATMQALTAGLPEGAGPGHLAAIATGSVVTQLTYEDFAGRRWTSVVSSQPSYARPWRQEPTGFDGAIWSTDYPAAVDDLVGLQAMRTWAYPTETIMSRTAGLPDGAGPGVLSGIRLGSTATQVTYTTATGTWHRIVSSVVELVTPWTRPNQPTPPATPAAWRTVPLALTVGGNGTSPAGAQAVRFPIRYAAMVRRWRAHITHVNPRNGAYGEDLYLSGVWIGEHSGNGLAPRLTNVAKAANLSNENDGSPTSLVTPWVSNYPINPDTDYLLSVGLSESTTPAHGSVAGCWISPTRNDAYSQGGGTWTRSATSPVDVWIEAEVDPRVPIVAALGDSLASGFAATLPVYDSWLSQWCRDHGALPVHYTASGDTMGGWTNPGAFKWRRWSHLSRPDCLVHAMGTNDLFIDGADLQTMKARHAQTVSMIRDRLTPNIYGATILPRTDRSDAPESVRRDYNAWLATQPNGIRDLFDFAAAVSTDDETLTPEYDADGVHLNTAGYTRLAAALNRPIIPTP